MLKRLFALLFVAAMVLSLCACGKTEKSKDTPSTTASTTTTAENTTTTTESTTTTTKKTTTTTTTPTVPFPDDVVLPTQSIRNILLFGLDERGEVGASKDGLGKAKYFHSDAITILTIDRRNPDKPRIKLSAIARDTLVYIKGYNSKDSKTKLCNAFDVGYRSAKKADTRRQQTEADYRHAGAKSAVKVINQNFHLNITDYAFMSFVEFMDVIDTLGGVTIDVQERELAELNKHIRSMAKECKRTIATLPKAGKQTLSGGQALAYARIRKIDSDLQRINRQRNVMKAAFAKVQTLPLTQLPTLIGQILSKCNTTLSAVELAEIGTWAVTNHPTFTSYTLPSQDCNQWGGTHPNYGWVWIYDLNYASALLIDFIYDMDITDEMPKPAKYKLN